MSEFWSAISAISGFLAAFAAFKTVIESRKGTHTEIASALLSEYAMPEMLDDIFYLKAYKEGNGEEFDRKFAVARCEPVDRWSKEFVCVDKARRHITHFFNKVGVLLQLNLIDNRSACKVITSYQLDMYMKYCYPLEAATADEVDERFRKDSFTFLERIKYAHSLVANGKA